MSAKHRKASKLAAKRTAVAATAVGATAAVGLMGAPAQAATTAPDYSKAISDYSHALDNYLNAVNNVNGSLNSVWGPIANGTGGVLPTFGSSYNKIDATDLANLGKVLINLGSITLPTKVPGIVPNVQLPGAGKIVLPLPTKIPGGDVLIAVGNTVNTLTSNEIVKYILANVPSGSDIINGLEFTMANYQSKYNWGLLGVKGETNVLNTFLQTPSGLSLDLLGIPAIKNNTTLQDTLKFGLAPLLGKLPKDVDLSNVSVLANDSLPSGTVWAPQGDGTYDFPLGARLGWWAAAPTAALKIPAGWNVIPGLGGTDTVVSVPIYAAGARLPLNLAELGVVGANVLLPTANGVYSPVGLTMTNLNTILPLGLTNINVTTGNYVGTNGINVNNGQNLVLLQNPLGIPLPLVYGLGGFNFGVDGAGLTSPSLFGFKLFTDDLLQVGTKAGPNSSAGLIPPGLLPTDPMSQVITGITGPLGVSSLTQILGLDAIIKPVMTAFGPVYQVISSATLKPLSDFATSQYGPFINNSASQLLDLSKTLSQQTANLPGAPNSVPAKDSGAQSRVAATNDNAPNQLNLLNSPQEEPSGAHGLGEGRETVQQLTNRLAGGNQQSNNAADEQKATPPTPPAADENKNVPNEQSNTGDDTNNGGPTNGNPAGDNNSAGPVNNDGNDGGNNEGKVVEQQTAPSASDSGKTTPDTTSTEKTTTDKDTPTTGDEK